APLGPDLWRHDLVHVEEAVLLQADIDERRLHAGQDVVDAPLVDIAHDRTPSPPLDVELGDPPVFRPGPRSLPPGTATAAPPSLGLALEDRDTGLAPVDGDQYLLTHRVSSLQSDGGHYEMVSCFARAAWRAWT